MWGRPMGSFGLQVTDKLTRLRSFATSLAQRAKASGDWRRETQGKGARDGAGRTYGVS